MTTPQDQPSRRELLRRIGAGAVVLGGLAACAPAPGLRPTDSGKRGKPVKDFAFTSWAMNEQTSKPFVRKVIDGYQKSRKLRISTPSYPYNDYLEQLLLQARGRQLSGAVQLDIAWLGAVAALDVLRDLAPVAERAGYTDAALASGTVDGKQLGLPWTTGSIGLIVDPRMLDAAGVEEHPRTVREFETTLEAIRRSVPGVVPYAASTKVEQLKDILTWMQVFGCELLAGDEITIGDEASVEAVAWYKRLYDRKLIAPDVDRFDARALFAQGKAAIYEDAIVGKGVVAAESPDKGLANRIEPMVRPVLAAGDRPRAALWGHIVAVIDDQAGESAVKFAEHLTSDRAIAIGYYGKTALPPTTTAALGDKTIAGDRFTTTWTRQVTATAKPSPFWAFPQYAQMETAVAEQVQAVLVGDTRPADGMRKARDTLQRLVR